MSYVNAIALCGHTETSTVDGSRHYAYVTDVA